MSSLYETIRRLIPGPGQIRIGVVASVDSASRTSVVNYRFGGSERVTGTLGSPGQTVKIQDKIIVSVIDGGAISYIDV